MRAPVPPSVTAPAVSDAGCGRNAGPGGERSGKQGAQHSAQEAAPRGAIVPGRPYALIHAQLAVLGPVDRDRVLQVDRVDHALQLIQHFSRTMGSLEPDCDEL